MTYLNRFLRMFSTSKYPGDLDLFEAFSLPHVNKALRKAIMKRSRLRNVFLGSRKNSGIMLPI